jgi:hypothetical protein
MDIFKQSYDWDPFFRKVMLGTMFLTLLPAEFYMRYSAADTLGFSAWLMLPVLATYFLPLFIAKRSHLKLLFIGLLALNFFCMIMGFKDFYYNYLVPLVGNTVNLGFLYTAGFQSLFFFGCAYHIWIWTLLKKG